MRPFRGDTARPQREGPEPGPIVGEMLASDGWRLAAKALQQRQWVIARRCCTHRYGSLEELAADQREYALMEQMLRDPQGVLTPKEE